MDYTIPMNDFITPEEFGAKGDGVTDDTLAFMKAINSVSDIPVGIHSSVIDPGQTTSKHEPGPNFGKYILLGNKTYYLKNGLNIDTYGVTIIGCGQLPRDDGIHSYGTIIKADKGIDSTVKISASNVTLKNIIVKGGVHGFKFDSSNYRGMTKDGFQHSLYYIYWNYIL